MYTASITPKPVLSLKPAASDLAVLCKPPPLTLKRNNAVHIRDFMNGKKAEAVHCNAGKKMPSVVRYIPDHDLLWQFIKVPLLKSSQIIVAAFIRDTERSYSPCCPAMPGDIVLVCKAFLLHSEDAYFQLAFRLFTVLQRLNKPTVPVKAIQMVIANYLKENDPVKLNGYIAELKRLDYIESPDEAGKFYAITMLAKISFMSIASRRRTL
mmetsp:Transcript_43350/g.69465  ORF Transcript_43350/g.69465 Transcript_43350/m.69465 type:complete len:210 (-) Transcript_43350:446-1075(-)|eukprot:CAMPEP_0197068284 /NCGR_PEP_ID=MMETSP1384-20130603/185611_1 /TAXON_ID=29189 /ORGANISM="Ammonia sp." /LENGTH=209 /DNA_ID=CAMNT_0042505977 /DNA_START=88 /DNA_END=717 /DNA_ORIENTATION=-